MNAPVFSNMRMKMRFDRAYADFMQGLASMPARWVAEQQSQLYEELEIGIRCGKDFWKVSAEAGVLVLRWRGIGLKDAITQEEHTSSLISY